MAAVIPTTRGTVFVDGRDLARAGRPGPGPARRLRPSGALLTFNFSVLDFVLTGRAAFIPAFSSPARRRPRGRPRGLAFRGVGRIRGETRSRAQLRGKASGP
ncbi:MAG: hypothetical protein M0C28_39415 [Candidatus Moduliflexus flocculans]|nr:hypothetical protein [Candidatus Moduliflexus flocculans]